MYLYHYVFFTLLILYSVPLFFFYLHRVYMDYISTPLQSGTTTFDITVAPELRDVSCRKTYMLLPQRWIAHEDAHSWDICIINERKRYCHETTLESFRRAVYTEITYAAKRLGLNIDEDKLELYIASIFMITCESIRVARQLKNTKLEIIHKCCLHRYTVYKKKSITQ
jgi:hypothetical protein